MSEQDRISFSEACRELQISEDELESMVADGEIACVKDGDTIFFKPEVIAQIKRSKKTEPTIILSDDELDLLDSVGTGGSGEEISLDDLDLGGDELDLSPAKDASVPEPTASLAAKGDDVEFEELDLSEISLDDDVATESAPIAADTAGADDLGDLDDVTLEDEISLDGREEPSLTDTSSDTVLSLDGLLDDDPGSEATTPVPGSDVGDLDFA